MTESTSRLHPLIAAAAVSVIGVSALGAASLAGWLPSKSAPAPAAAPALAAAPSAAPLAPAALSAASLNSATPAPLVVSAPPGSSTYVQASSAPGSPVVIVKQEPAAPAAQRAAAKPKPRPAARPVRYDARHTDPYRPAPQAYAPAPSQPSYVGIASGAVIGGLIGNQIGGGNGKKLATLAGVIGGGYVGNEIAKRNR